jgi:hypothetical protein
MQPISEAEPIPEPELIPDPEPIPEPEPMPRAPPASRDGMVDPHCPHREFGPEMCGAPASADRGVRYPRHRYRFGGDVGTRDRLGFGFIRRGRARDRTRA